jgi:hypothetical protein
MAGAAAPWYCELPNAGIGPKNKRQENHPDGETDAFTERRVRDKARCEQNFS